MQFCQNSHVCPLVQLRIPRKAGLRILLVNSHLIPRGGDWTYVSILGQVLQQHGHEVLLYGLAVPGSQTTMPLSELVSDLDFKAAFARRSLRDILHVVSRTIYSFEAEHSMQRAIEKYKPDIVHLNNIHHFLTPSIVWPIVRNQVPIVWTLHDYTIICPNTTFVSDHEICESCRSQKFYNCVLKKCKRGSYAASFLAAAEAYCHHWMRAFDRVSAFIAPSSFLLEKFVEQGFQPKKVIHIANPIPTIFEDEERPIQGSGLYIGRLSEEKGVGTLVRALAGLPNMPFDIIGDGPLRSSLEDYCKKRLLDRVRFYGSVSADAATEFVKNCRFVVVPSEWYENCPYAVLEAMQFGKPVVASAIGGLPELVHDQKNGILCPVGNVTAFMTAIHRLSCDDALCKKFGNKGARLARLEYDVDTYYRKILAVYTSVLKHPV